MSIVIVVLVALAVLVVLGAADRGGGSVILGKYAEGTTNHGVLGKYAEGTTNHGVLGKYAEGITNHGVLADGTARLYSQLGIAVVVYFKGHFARRASVCRGGAAF